MGRKKVVVKEVEEPKDNYEEALKLLNELIEEGDKTRDDVLDALDGDLVDDPDVEPDEDDEE